MTSDERTGYRSGDRASGVVGRATLFTKRTASAAGSTPGATDPRCERCGAAMIERHCKLICTRCGYQRDCSDP